MNGFLRVVTGAQQAEGAGRGTMKDGTKLEVHRTEKKAAAHPKAWDTKNMGGRGRPCASLAAAATPQTCFGSIRSVYLHFRESVDPMMCPLARSPVLRPGFPETCFSANPRRKLSDTPSLAGLGPAVLRSGGCWGGLGEAGAAGAAAPGVGPDALGADAVP